MRDGLGSDAPLSPSQAQQLAKKILKGGRIAFTKHAREQMAERNLEKADVVNILRGGQVVDEPESTARGTFTYKFETNAMCTVIEFRGESELAVITAYRFDRRWL